MYYLKVIILLCCVLIFFSKIVATELVGGAAAPSPPLPHLARSLHRVLLNRGYLSGGLPTTLDELEMTTDAEQTTVSTATAPTCD